MTDISRAAVDALLQGVTEGPWFPNGVNGGGRPTMVYSDDATGSAIADTVLTYVSRRTEESEANARFIAAARELVPALLAQNAALRAALDEAEARAVKAEAERDAANAALRVIAAEISIPVRTWKNGINFKAMYEAWRKEATKRADLARAHLGAKP